MGCKIKNRLAINKGNYIYCVIALLLIVCSIFLFPFHRITTNQLADNPQGCHYYVTLLSILSNYPSLAADKANAKFIKHRMLRFEHDITHTKKAPDIIAAYKNSYHALLSEFGVKSIKSVHDDKLSLAIANKSYGIIDNYYLDDRLYCINPLYFQLGSHSRRILQYNFGGLYYSIPNRYSRILAAFPNDSQLGVFSGFFVNNQTTALETQFETGMPILTALYVLPKYDFSKVGSYSALVPWGYFGIDSIIDPLTRKLLDIAGIDIFTVLKSYMLVKKIQGFKGTVPVDSPLRPMFGGDAQPFINTQSYGMAYLANHINYRKISDIEPYERMIKEYFSIQSQRDPKIFTHATQFFYKQLMGLKSKQDVILEVSNPKNIAVIDSSQPAGFVTIKGIVGPRALFDVNCKRENCTFVFNVSDAPGWHAFVNGNSSNINRANFAFMSTTVPKGYSTIWFIYEPFSALMSYFISILSLIFFISLGIVRETK